LRLERCFLKNRQRVPLENKNVLNRLKTQFSILVIFKKFAETQKSLSG